MKLNWGNSIAIFYTLFVIFMVGMVVYSKNFDHSLVVENYYEKDLNYQSHLDKVANSQALEVDLDISKNEERKVVTFTFPADFESVSGEILFYRADDETKDFTVTIHPVPGNAVEVPVGDLATGRWQIKVDWQGGGRAFFKEKTVIL